MAGGKSRPRKDKAVKVSEGQPIKCGEILIRGLSAYRAGENVEGRGTLYALCPGKVHFSKKKTPHGKPRTFVNIAPTDSKK